MSSGFLRRFTFEYFSNASSMDSSHMTHSQESSLISAGSQKATVSRSQSDSSTISTKSNRAASKANHSVDNVHAKNQLLKFSLLNSTSSPMKCHTSLTDSVFAEARKIARQFANSRESSFEDLNNVSQPSEAGDVSFVDPDLQAMNLKVPSNKSLPPQATSTKPSAEKIAEFQEQLKRIKKEVDSDDNEDFRHETKQVLLESTSTPVKVKVEEEEDNQVEVDRLLHKLRSVITDGNKEAAKKQLTRLNELLEKQKDPNEAKNTVNVVQPIVRQATFDIDPTTGKRKYTTNEEQTQKTEGDDIVEKLTRLLAGQTLNIHSINTNGEKLLLVVPSSVTTTPEKNPMKKILTKSHSAMKSLDTRKLGTPMKRQLQVGRPASFTTPRPMSTSRKTNPYEQKSCAQPRATGAVRKSLMSSMEKSPQVQKSKVSTTTGAVFKPTTARRSLSMKASIPAVQVTKSSPLKPAPRPSTGAPYGSTNKRLSLAPGIKTRASTANVPSSPRSRTLSDHKKPVSQFKAPSAFRKANGVDNNGSLV